MGQGSSDHGILYLSDLAEQWQAMFALPQELHPAPPPLLYKLYDEARQLGFPPKSSFSARCEGLNLGHSACESFILEPNYGFLFCYKAACEEDERLANKQSPKKVSHETTEKKMSTCKSKEENNNYQNQFRHSMA